MATMMIHGRNRKKKKKKEITFSRGAGPELGIGKLRAGKGDCPFSCTTAFSLQKRVIFWFLSNNKRSRDMR